MARYDVIINQNLDESGVDFFEIALNMDKGSIISGADTTRQATLLAAGTNGHYLVRDDAETTGLKWITPLVIHDQNTDTGTTSTTFKLDSDTFDIELTAESSSKAGIKVSGGATYADLEAKDGTFNIVTVGSASPTGNYELCHKTYVDGIMAANDAMLFKGTVGSGGTHEIAAFNSLATYDIGWTYRVITAGTIKGAICQIGDIIMAVVARSGSGEADADWTVMQENIDGAVIGPASVTDGYHALFDGTSGKLIKAGVIPHVATSVSTTNGLSISTQEISLQVANTSQIGALTDTDWDTFNEKKNDWESVPASKTAAGTAGQMAYDGNYLYICVDTNIWRRNIIAQWT